MYNPNFNFVLQGWECPKCHRIYSPNQNFCLYCNDNRVIYATTTSNEWRKNTTIDDILRRDYYDDEDLWGKPL